MQTEDFRNYLLSQYPDSLPTVNARMSNCLNVEKHYGDLDINYGQDLCKSILAELVYSKDDENNGVSAIHKIPINGNLRTGSATLKHAVKLYVDFKNFMNDAESSISNKITVNNTYNITASSDIRQDLINLLDDFTFDSLKHKDVLVLQQDLLEYLISNLSGFDWEIEFKPKDGFKDSIDVYGASKTSNLKVVIELDAHRADQVAKKFISRTALLANENLIYVSLCYPGTEKMNKVECEKYFTYCSEISNQISKVAEKEQLYIGYFLN